MSDRREFLKTSLLGAAAVAAASNLPLEAEAQIAPSFQLDEVTLADLRAGLNSGKFTSKQLVEMYSERISAIDRHGPNVRAVIELNPDAMALAEKADEDRKAGKRGLMHGIPVLIKDNIGTADKMATSAGSLALADSHPSRDSFVAAQLRAAGAVILGKTNLSEWANFRSTHSTSGWSGRGGLTRCPYALDRNPSGSSSGSAVAVSANECPVAVGSETDGSIVSPACSNGLVGIKPTVGLVGRTGIVPISHTQDTAGPLARTVADAAALLTVLAGIDPNDEAAKGAQGKIEDYMRALDLNGLRGARLGVVRKYAGFSIPVDKLFADALDVMRKAGAEIIDPVEIAGIDKFGDAELVVLKYEFKNDLNAYFNSLGPNSPIRSLADVIDFDNKHAVQEMPYFGQELLIQSQEKGPLTDPDYLKALDTCGKLTRTEGIDAVMDKHKLDALISPTGTPAWMTDLVNGDANVPSASSLAAVAGYPHVTLPMGYVFGLPVGISFYGRAWSEAKLIRLAYGYEQLTRFRRAPEFLTTAKTGI
jgi:amidase